MCNVTHFAEKRCHSYLTLVSPSALTHTPTRSIDLPREEVLATTNDHVLETTYESAGYAKR